MWGADEGQRNSSFHLNKGLGCRVSPDWLCSAIRAEQEVPSFFPISLAHMDRPPAQTYLKSNHFEILFLELAIFMASESTWKKMCDQVLWLSSPLHLPMLTLYPQPAHLPSPSLGILVLAASYASMEIQKAQEFWVLSPAQPPAFQTSLVTGASLFLQANGTTILCLGRTGL